MSHPLVKLSLRRGHARTVKNGASNHKTNYNDIFSEIENLEGHQHHCIRSKLTVIWLNRLMLLNDGASLGRGLRLQPAQQACLGRHEMLFSLLNPTLVNIKTMPMFTLYNYSGFHGVDIYDEKYTKTDNLLYNRHI